MRTSWMIRLTSSTVSRWVPRPGPRAKQSASSDQRPDLTSGAKGDTARLPDLRQGAGHGFGKLDFQDAVEAFGDTHCDQSRARSEGGARREGRRSG